MSSKQKAKPMNSMKMLTYLAALSLIACGAEPGLDVASETQTASEESALRIETGAPVTECTACADDEWGSYVRMCCTTYDGVKTCRQEGCRRPGGDTLPIGPSDSGGLPSVDYDEPKFDVIGK
jgi:hypothetical protein